MDYLRENRVSCLRGFAACCLAAIAGCTAHTGVEVTGAAPADVSHLWVTVEEVWWSPAADTLPESQSGWTRKALASPVVLDLATLDPGSPVSLAPDIALPAGNYRQLHLVLADSADPLVAAARAAGLLYNAQVELSDTSTGAVTTAPLELPAPGAGITIPVDLTFTGRSSSSNSVSSSSGGATSSSGGAASIKTLVAALDASRDVLTYDYGSGVGYLFSPVTSVEETSAAGAISGNVDASGLPADHPPISVSAELLDGTGTHHVVVNRRQIAADGSFTLYPLPASTQGTTEYDLVISCAGADSVLVRNIPVTAGASSAATVVQSTPIVLTPARTVYAALSSQTPALPGGTRVDFYESVPGRNEVPYVIDGAHVDPQTLRLPDDAFALASGALVVGTYAAGGAISFDTTVPAEGQGAYRVGTSGLYRADTLSTNPVVVQGSSTTNPTLTTAPSPTISAGGIQGTLTISVQAPAGRFDSGFVTISAGNRLIETASVGSLLQNGGGTIAVANLPAGSSLAPKAGVPYQVALRAWNSRDPAGTLTRVAAANSVTLGDLGVAAIALQAP